MSVSLRIFEDEALTRPLSLDGTMTNPDSGVFNGTIGQREVETLYLGNMRTELANALDATAGDMFLAQGVFDAGDIVFLGATELAAIIGDLGGGHYTIDRGVLGTAIQSYTAGTVVRAAYDYADITVSGHDTDATDESGWCRVSLTYYDASSPEWDTTAALQLNIGSVAYNETVMFYRNIVVPPGQSAFYKSDLRWRVRAKRLVHRPS